MPYALNTPALVCAITLAAPPVAATELHYAPIENLERLDVQQLNTARKTIDIAAYVLTDRPIIGALLAAAYRGVRVRVYLDGGQSSGETMAPDGPLGNLYKAPNVTVKDKRQSQPIMHLKSYCIDGRVFRPGSANFTASGLKQQDNDLMLSKTGSSALISPSTSISSGAGRQCGRAGMVRMRACLPPLRIPAPRA